MISQSEASMYALMYFNDDFFLQIFDFTLSFSDMERIAELDQNKRTFTIDM